MKKCVQKGFYQLAYFTQEMRIDASRRWQKVLLSDVYSNQLHAFVVDKAHIVVKW